MRVLVREGWDGDIDWMIAQMQEFSKFYGTRYPLFNESTIKDGITNLIKNHFVRIATGCNDVGFIDRMGFIVGILTPHPYNPTIKVLSEQFFWIDPKYRGSRAAVLLLNAFVDFGKAKANWVTMAIDKHSQMNERALSRRGFTLLENSYLLEVAA